MRYKALELDKPLTYELEGLEIGVTSNCNFRCDYCCAYNRNDGQSIKAKEVIQILDELPGLKRVRLSGGEVTLKFDDCVEIVNYCSSRGIQTQLNSNGSLLNAERIDQLVTAGLRTIHISFNFTTADAFSRYYNIHPSIYEKIRENITIAAREQLKNAVSELIAMKKEDTILYFTCMDRFMDALGFEEQTGVYFPHCIEGKKQLHLHGNGDILISELCHPVIIGNIYQGTSLKDLYRNMPAPLAQFLDKLPCPALDALFPQGV